MPTAREVNVAEKIMRDALQEVGLQISTDGGTDSVTKIVNKPENVGLKPLLALTAAIIRKAREFKQS